MFYGRNSGGSDFGRGGGPPRRNDRFEQMTKQQELIEQKKREIQAKLEADRRKKEMEQLLGKVPDDGDSSSAGRGVSPPSSSSTNKQSSGGQDGEETKPVIPNLKFTNDGSFLEQFRRMQEEQKRKEEEENAKIKEEPADNDDANEYGTSASKSVKPLIKYINPPARVSSPNNAPVEHIKQEPRETRSNIPPPSFYDQRDQKPVMRSPERNYNDYDRISFRSGGYQNVPPPPPPPPPPQGPKSIPGGFPSQVVRRLAQQVAELGDHVEEITRTENRSDPLLWFLQRPDSNEYKKYRDLVAEYVEEFRIKDEKKEYGSMLQVQPKRQNASSSDEDDDNDDRGAARRRKRRSRWGPGEDGGEQMAAVPPPFMPIKTEFEGPSMNLRGVPPPPPPPPSAPYAAGSASNIPPLMAQELPPQFQLTGNSGMSWGGKMEMQSLADQKPPSLLGNFPLMNTMDFDFDVKPVRDQPLVTKVTRTNPQLLAYAQQAYGSTNLDEEQWKQCEEAYKMNLIFQDIARKKARDTKLEIAGKFKHEYDSDEEVDGGTWEHKQRMKEMEKTRDWATELTSKAKGKHHIGDFLPPEELAKFMEKYKAVKEGRQLDASDYQEFKIAESNLGFKMLQKMGWTEGQGLGSSGQGITAPIEKGQAVSDKQGLGQEKPDDLNEDDDEYTAYRKRMMLAYRFRPNPLNNPRRAYY